MTVNVDKINQLRNLKQRYSFYQDSENDDLTGDKLQEFIKDKIKAAHSGLIQKEQLQELTDILRYPGNTEPKEIY